MEPYTEFKLMYPPRTESTIPYGDNPVLKMLKRHPDSIAQFKMNGNRNLIFGFPDGTIQMWNRGGKDEPQTQQKFEIPNTMLIGLQSMFPKGKWTIWDSELIHTKTKTVKNVVYIFDVLVWESQHLIGMNYGERFKIAQDLMGKRFMPLEADAVTENIYIAENMPPEKWDTAWAMAQPSPYCEGLVFKRVGNISALKHGYQVMNNSGFMCKSRKPTKNFCQ